MNKLRQLILGLLIIASTISFAQTTIYTNDMDYVLGDVKQAFIQDKINTADQIEYLLIGFKAMKVNGIRVPIFPEGQDPNAAALQYFCQRAIEDGFEIFANPAQTTGGKHLATGESSSDKVVKDDAEMTQALIDRILAFNEKIPCKWINPFNEDGQPGSVWSAPQMDTIYSRLNTELQNTELIGSCTWGLAAAIDIFKDTNIKDYITVSTAHNLGFNHDLWTEFIDSSHAAGLPVWDSEVNHTRKYENKTTRLEAAIENGVDGLVLYDSYNFINLETGEISTTGQEWMEQYIKATVPTDTIVPTKLNYSEEYMNEMDYILGDAKQIFIQDKISTETQAENLLIGFKAMKVNGIRIPIFPEGLTPNETALQYFIERATEEGFEIFANPAQGTGGKHIATGEFFSDKVVKDDPEMTQALIDRILEFDKEYPCKWINPFNEDSRTETVWSIDQMNTIYSTLSNELQNAELIGSCSWGLVAAIDIFEKTNIKDYITVSTTHNLGFNHDLWTEFIDMSHAVDLPVWDSEVNHNRKYENKSTRLEAAIEYGVDGLVLYNSSNFISLVTSEVNATGQAWMDLYLKPEIPTILDYAKSETLFANIYNVTQGFRIEFINSDKHDIRIFDISGKQIRSYNNISESEVQINGLDKGMYVVAMSSGNERQIEKVVIY